MPKMIIKNHTTESVQPTRKFGKKSEAEGLDSLVGMKNVKEIEKKIDSLGLTFVESGDYAGHTWGYAVYKSPKGEYLQYDYNGTNDVCRSVKVYKSKQDFIDAEGYDPEKSESKKSEALTKQQILVRASKNPKIDDLLSAMGSEWVKVLPVDSNSITKRSTGERLHSNKFSNADTQTTLEIAWTDDGIVEWARNTAIYEEPMTESKKSEASKFGAGMSPIKDLSKLRNFGEVLDVLEEHRKHLQAKAEDLKQSKDDLEASIKKLQEFSKNVDMLKQQSIKGIKDAISFNKSPEVKAAADIEQALKDALKVVYSDYANIPDVMQLLTVLDSRYATRGDKVVTAWMDNATRAIEVDAQTIKDSIADGLMNADDVVQLVTVTRATYGVKDKFAQGKLTPILERMNAMLATAPKLEEAVIDPKQFKELRDLIEQIVNEASTPTAIVKTKISTLSKSDIASLPKAGESLVSEGLLDKLKEMVSILKDKISALWDSFTSLFFGLEDDALDASETFGEVEETFAVVGIVVESYTARKRVTLGKKFEVLTKSVLTCCDNLVKDAALAGEFDDEVIYAEDAVKNAVESFKQLGEACVTLKNALSYHKNEDNMNVIGILADAITQIVADDEGGSADGGETDSEEDEDSVIDQVEQEYSPEGGEEGGGEELTSDGEPGEAPNPAGMPEPEL